MRKLLILFIIPFVLIGCGRIDQGHKGVRTTFTGDVLEEELNQGFYTAFTSDVEEYTAKEMTVEVFDMTPKAADNLSLSDFDMEVYYIVDESQIAEKKIKYSGRDGWEKGIGFSCFFLVRSMARETAYDIVSNYKSLEIHKNRDVVRRGVHEALQSRLNETDPGYFTITKVVIRNIKTDPSVEDAIKQAVAKNKELEAKKIELDIVAEQVKINHALDASLTDKILRQREIDVMEKAVTSGSKPIVLLGGGGTPLINIK
jgi:regulator of protease activity HflC (stomatin/prohibitin superfamily)